VPPATTIASLIIDSCNIFSFLNFTSALNLSDMQFASAGQFQELRLRDDVSDSERTKTQQQSAQSWGRQFLFSAK